MVSDHPSPDSESRTKAGFPATRWTVVLQAQRAGTPQATLALEELCRDYWFPIYAFLRRQGHSRHDAEDLTQGFFERILSEDTIRSARRERGRLRSFLIGALKRHLAAEHRTGQALKRGGGAEVIPLDADEAEQRYNGHLTSYATPETVFERAWANELLNGVRNRLRDSYARGGKERLFDTLSGYLAWNDSDTPYLQAAAKLDISAAAVRVQVHRMRHRYRQLLEERVADTVASPEEIKEELDYLISVIRK